MRAEKQTGEEESGPPSKHLQVRARVAPRERIIGERGGGASQRVWGMREGERENPFVGSSSSSSFPSHPDNSLSRRKLFSVHSLLLLPPNSSFFYQEVGSSSSSSSSSLDTSTVLVMVERHGGDETVTVQPQPGQNM